MLADFTPESLGDAFAFEGNKYPPGEAGGHKTGGPLDYWRTHYVALVLPAVKDLLAVRRVV